MRNKTALMTSKQFDILRSGWDAPYTDKPSLKLGKTKKVNKWSISAGEYCYFLSVLRTWRDLFALINLRLTWEGETCNNSGS